MTHRFESLELSPVMQDEEMRKCKFKMDSAAVREEERNILLYLLVKPVGVL